jgi:hypothetical protein
MNSDGPKAPQKYAVYRIAEILADLAPVGGPHPATMNPADAPEFIRSGIEKLLADLAEAGDAS